MTFEIALVLCLFAVAVVALWTEKLSPDAVALGLVAALVLAGILTAEEAFRGLAGETIIVLACVMVLSRRLSDSGIVARMMRRLVQSGSGGGRAASMRFMGVSAAMSTMFSNTSTTAILLPAAEDAARRLKLPPGQILMPMAFASMMGGSATLIGTSTNLAASGAVTRMGLEPFGLLEFALPGLVVTLAGILLVGFAGPLFIAARGGAGTGREERTLFLANFRVPEGSKAEGLTISEIMAGTDGATALAVLGAEGRQNAHGLRKLHAGDRLVVRAPRETLIAMAHDGRLALNDGEPPGRALVHASAVALPGARWLGQTIGRVKAGFEGDPAILALHRGGDERGERLDRMRLRTGDVLLLEGTEPGIRSLRGGADFYLQRGLEPAPTPPREGWVTLAAFAAALAVGAAGLAPLSVALLVALLGLVVTGRLTMQDAYEAISWRILILIGGMSSFGLAMLQTGAAGWLARGMLAVTEPLGLYGVMAGLALVTILLTQPMSNAAAALTVLPVAVAVAESMGVDPRPLAVIVTLSASLSFITPLEPALLLVHEPGHYRLRDFILGGVPVTLLSLCILLVLVPVLWPPG